MKQFPFLFLILYHFNSYSQETRLDLLIELNELGQKNITIPDTSLFEFYYNSNDDKGVRLMSSLDDGLYSIYENDTLTYKAVYKNRMMDSIWTYYFPNGAVSWFVTFKKGIKDGIIKKYRPTGKLLSEGIYTNGQLNDWWIDYDENGNVFLRTLYSSNEKIKIEQYYNSGKLKSEVNFKEEKYNGINTEYYENGKIKQKLFFTMDTLTRVIKYDENEIVKVDKLME